MDKDDIHNDDTLVHRVAPGDEPPSKAEPTEVVRVRLDEEPTRVASASRPVPAPPRDAKRIRWLVLALAIAVLIFVALAIALLSR